MLHRSGPDHVPTTSALHCRQVKKLYSAIAADAGRCRRRIHADVAPLLRVDATIGSGIALQLRSPTREAAQLLREALAWARARLMRLLPFAAPRSTNPSVEEGKCHDFGRSAWFRRPASTWLGCRASASGLPTLDRHQWLPPIGGCHQTL